MLAIIVLIYCLNSLDRGIVGAVLEPIKHEFRLSDSDLGLLSGLVFGVPHALLCIPMGLLIDRVSRKRVLMAVVSIWSAATALAAFAPSFAMLLICRATTGGAEAGTAPACLSLIADRYQRHERAGAYSLMYFGAAMGGAAASLLGGLAAYYSGWRAAFLIAGLPGLMAVFLLWRFVREPIREGAGETHELHGLGAAVRLLGRHRPLAALLCGVPFAGIATYGPSMWLVAYLVREHGFDLAQAGGTVAVLIGGGTGIGALVSGVVASRLRSISAALSYVGGCMLAGAVLAAFALRAQEISVLLSALFVWQVLVTNFIAPTTSALMTFTPATMRGTISAWREILATLAGLGLGPLLIGVVSDALGGPTSLRDALILVTVSASVLAGMAFLGSAAFCRRDGEQPRVQH